MSILYAKFEDPKAYDALKRVAGLAGLSIRETAEAIITASITGEHVFAEQVKRAIRKHRSAQ